MGPPAILCFQMSETVTRPQASRSMHTRETEGSSMRAKVKNGIGLLINAYQLAAICVLLWLLVVAIALFLTEPARGATRMKDTPTQAAGDEEAQRSRLDAARAHQDPRAILAAARFICVHSKTAYLKRESLESSLQRSHDFQQLGLAVTKDFE